MILRAEVKFGLPALVFLVVNSNTSPGSASWWKSWLLSRVVYALVDGFAEHREPVLAAGRHVRKIEQKVDAFAPCLLIEARCPCAFGTAEFVLVVIGDMAIAFGHWI